MNRADIHTVRHAGLHNSSQGNLDIRPDHGVLAGIPEFTAMHVVFGRCMGPPHVRFVRHIRQGLVVGVLFPVGVGSMRAEGIVSVDADLLAALFGASIQNAIGRFAAQCWLSHFGMEGILQDPRAFSIVLLGLGA